MIATILKKKINIRMTGFTRTNKNMIPLRAVCVSIVVADTQFLPSEY